MLPGNNTETGLREYFTRLVADTITISVKLGVEVVGKHIQDNKWNGQNHLYIYFRRNNTIVICL